MPIQENSRVYCPEHPEDGFGVVRLVEENLLDDTRTCQVDFEWSPGLRGVPEDALVRVPSFRSHESIPENGWGGPDDLRRRLGAALAMAENSRTGGFMRSFAKPLPHQAFLLDRIVSHERFGHVIADDVGMGKTVEAGLVIAAMRQRDPRSRVLILSPAGVVLQWQDEMSEHFGLDFSIAGRDFSPKSLPNWRNHNLILASIDTLKQERYRDILKEAPPFDLVVCDEAHRLTARREFLSNELYRTQNYRFAEWISAERVVEWVASRDGSPRSPRFLLLTATPHQGDDLRFAYLLQLARPDRIQAESALDPEGGIADHEALAETITRTAKKAAVDWNGDPIFKGHESKTLDVALCDKEREVLADLTAYVLNTMRFSGGDNALTKALALHTFQKIAASSWAALEAALENRLNGRQTDADEFSGEESLDIEGAMPVDDGERVALEGLILKLRTLPKNSKWDRFSEIITPGEGFREPGDRLLIFTQYRRTQEWLEERLTEAGERVAIIHGGLNLDERKNQRAYFEEDGTVLLSTEAGGEGANLHRKCHLEVNYDLPWNPMRLLQRIGRLDRYGQRHRVRVLNLRAPLSWDSEISVRIAAKLENVQSSMGSVADEDYQYMILGEIHEAVNVPDLMKRSDWGRDSDRIDAEIDERVREVLSRRSSLDQLFSQSLGMPAHFGELSPSLDPDAFRAIFSWVATEQGVQLKESRTSDNRFLKGVYHFTLPSQFRVGLRPSREVYLVFDRELFAEVRHEELGAARNQAIRPNLAGFGDPVTDWFFKRGLQGGTGRSFFTLRRGEQAAPEERWWVSFAAKWKPSGSWGGPDAAFTFAIDANGTVLREVATDEVFRVIREAAAANPNETALPPLEGALSAARSNLRACVPPDADGANISLFPITAILWG